jgi:hypothetical protein
LPGLRELRAPLASGYLWINDFGARRSPQEEV